MSGSKIRSMNFRLILRIISKNVNNEVMVSAKCIRCNGHGCNGHLAVVSTFTQTNVFILFYFKFRFHRGHSDIVVRK